MIIIHKEMFSAEAHLARVARAAAAAAAPALHATAPRRIHDYMTRYVTVSIDLNSYKL